jgi:hypothetical protein
VPDLLCANFQDLSVLHGTGGGIFLGARGFPVEDGPISLALGDLDLDGHQDAVVIDLFQQTLSFLQGSADGSLVEITSVPLTAAIQETPGSVRLADLDDDGLLDVVVSIYQVGEVRVIRNPGTIAGFAPPTGGDIIAVEPFPLGMDLADLDGDEVLDAVIAGSGNDTVQVLLGSATRGTAAFSPQAPVAVPHRPGAVLLRDLDNDGDVDAAITAGERDNTDTHLMILSNDGFGVLALEATFPIASLSGSIDAADLNEDGLLDLVVAEPGDVNDHVSLFLNGGTLTFTQLQLTVGQSANAIRLADADQDGHVDILAALSAGELRIALGDGMGGFPAIEPLTDGELPLPYNTFAIGWSDMDGDDLPDLVLAAPNSPLVWVSKNLSIPNEEL